MKKIITIMLTMCVLTFTACANENTRVNNNSTAKGDIVHDLKINITINGSTKTATLENNSSVNALLEKLNVNDITINAHDYGGFEKVGDLGFSLPTSDRQMTSQNGDIFLYVGSSLVFFYGSNSWSYTKIGTLEGMTKSEVKEFLQGGKGNVDITLSLN